MISTESLIKSIGDNPLPPVEQWNPEFCGDLDLLIKADGTWLYQGTPFTRQRMRLLFSRVLKKEGEDYFLVTPVEKVGVQVEWMPFLIVDFDVIETEDNKTYFRFIDNCENMIDLKDKNQLKFSQFQQQPLPILKVRRNLFANFSRNCYYRLLDQAKTVEDHSQIELQICSNNQTFVIGRIPNN